MKMNYNILLAMLKDLKSNERQREYLILKFGTPTHISTKETHDRMKSDAALAFAWAVKAGVIERVGRSLNAGYKINEFYARHVF